MRKRSAPPPDSGDLLNLPLESNPGEGERLEPQDLLPFEGSSEAEASTEDGASLPRVDSEPSFGDRLTAGGVDLAAVVGALALAVIGSWALGARPELSDLPAFAVFVASFSYLYIVIPLTFWGRTPGMAFASLVARGHNTVPLTIRQGFRRWLGAILTIVLLGLPALLALTGTSLADRLSGTRLRRS